jgi:TPP-dependent pyruvate/acetoin dehydrogenase alpha subunit
MKPDLWELYRQMLRSRLFEQAVITLWEKGKISGEMHMGIGEEGISAGIVTQLDKEDAIALDHRGTSQFVMRDAQLSILLWEFLGNSKGLCCGMGGHMHLFSKELLMASSGIVGASGPAAVGFALAGRQLRPGSVSVAFFGEGAMNQGMLMESMNLAVVWKLPVLFICKDNTWAITTQSPSVTGGRLIDRAKSFGMPAHKIDGSDVEDVFGAANTAIKRARKGKGPTFLQAHCFRPEGHFLGDPLLRIAKHPAHEMKQVAGPLLKSFTKGKGASTGKRSSSLGTITSLIGKTTVNHYWKKDDPVARTRKKLKFQKERLHQLEEDVSKEIDKAVKDVVSSSI